jgi:hypothetical protein
MNLQRCNVNFNLRHTESSLVTRAQQFLYDISANLQIQFGATSLGGSMTGVPSVSLNRQFNWLLINKFSLLQVARLVVKR